jgi:hypothetical protein
MARLRKLVGPSRGSADVGSDATGRSLAVVLENRKYF